MLTGGRNVGDSLQRWTDGESGGGVGCIVRIDGIAVLKSLELKRKKKKEKEKGKGRRGKKEKENRER